LVTAYKTTKVVIRRLWFRVPDAVQRFFSGAPQSRDRTKHRTLYGPGSAAHRFAKGYALRCVRGTPGNDDFTWDDHALG
jgi:hypothetical protein